MCFGGFWWLLRSLFVLCGFILCFCFVVWWCLCCVVVMIGFDFSFRLRVFFLCGVGMILDAVYV